MKNSMMQQSILSVFIGAIVFWGVNSEEQIADRYYVVEFVSNRTKNNIEILRLSIADENRIRWVYSSNDNVESGFAVAPNFIEKWSKIEGNLAKASKLKPRVSFPIFYLRDEGRDTPITMQCGETKSASEFLFGLNGILKNDTAKLENPRFSRKGSMIHLLTTLDDEGGDFAPDLDVGIAPK